MADPFNQLIMELASIPGSIGILRVFQAQGFNVVTKQDPEGNVALRTTFDILVNNILMEIKR